MDSHSILNEMDSFEPNHLRYIVPLDTQPSLIEDFF